MGSSKLGDIRHYRDHSLVIASCVGGGSFTPDNLEHPLHILLKRFLERVLHRIDPEGPPQAKFGNKSS